MTFPSLTACISAFECYDKDMNKETAKWWEVYPQESSALFTLENSGKAKNLPPPYRAKFSGDNMELITYCCGWSIVGYTLNPPWGESDNTVAIMFEFQDGEKTWWHFLRED